MSPLTSWQSFSFVLLHPYHSAIHHSKAEVPLPVVLAVDAAQVGQMQNDQVEKLVAEADHLQLELDAVRPEQEGGVAVAAELVVEIDVGSELAWDGHYLLEHSLSPEALPKELQPEGPQVLIKDLE